MRCLACGKPVTECRCPFRAPPEFVEEPTRPEVFNYSRAVTERMLALPPAPERTRYDWPDDPVDSKEPTRP